MTDHDDNLPPGFTYLSRPPGMPASEWDDPEKIKLMARRLRELLERDAGRADDDKGVDQ
jgi:hypothetical protein